MNGKTGGSWTALVERLYLKLANMFNLLPILLSLTYVPDAVINLMEQTLSTSYLWSWSNHWIWRTWSKNHRIKL
jgi:hypothetical protein